MNDQERKMRDQDRMADHLVSGMTEGRKKAFELAAEAAKQLLTLSTGIIAFSVTFLKEVFSLTPHKISSSGFAALFAMWGFYLASAIAGVLTLSWLAARALDPEPELADSPAQSAGKWQMLLFAIAVLFTVALGVSLALSPT